MKSKLNHLAIIMDGNRRWAKIRGYRIDRGYTKGISALRNILEACLKRNIKELSVFALSTENWSRPKNELELLFFLIKKFIKSDIAVLNSKNIKFRIVGNKTVFNNSLLELLNSAENLTKNNDGMIFNVALNYGGKEDILYATKAMIFDHSQGILNEEDIDKNTFTQYLRSSYVSDIDLIIRTSNEKRLSNFFLWQSAYSEIFFSKKLWPEFDQDELDYAIENFNATERRFGASVLTINKR
tara:strand:+ start:127 stop:849 length:723 start_codon:yes stop_codon:yes gene_type:complete